MAKEVLFISGSIGLGHIGRDLAIANELRKRNPQVRMSWLAAHPVTIVLEAAGENLLPECDQFVVDSEIAEAASTTGFLLDLEEYSANAKRRENERVFASAIRHTEFDLVVADEAYEIFGGLLHQDIKLEIPFVGLFDFFGQALVTGDPLEIESAQDSAREFWMQLHKVFADDGRLAIFIGEMADIPRESFGPGFRHPREYARELFKFVGYILQFDPAAFIDRASIRAALGYGDETLVICSIGGTSVGRELLSLCGHAYTLVKERIVDLRMVLVCGPRLAADSLDMPSTVEVREFIPELYKHFAACDLAVVQGGGTSTLELTALRRPFLYFPLEGHFEQQIHVAGRLARHRAGVRMSYSETTPESLAEQIEANLGKEVTWPSIDTDGAKRAAQHICQFL